jgi:thymidylate kinase
VPPHPAPTALLPALESVGSVVVLRNHDVLVNLAAGGDVDLLVADLEHAQRALLAELGKPEFLGRRSYVSSLFYRWGHLDLLPTLEWRGARYLDVAVVLAGRDLSPWGLPRPRPAHEALISWFSSLLWGGFFKTRYREVIVDAARTDGEELARVLRVAAGRRWGQRLWQSAVDGRPEESQRWVGQVRRAVWSRALLRAPLETVTGAVRFCLAELRLRLAPPLPWLTVLGPDGSGKSMLVSALRDSWPATLGRVHTYHLRPRRVNRRRASTEPVVDPHGQPARGRIASCAVLALVLLDWWIGYWTQIAKQRAKYGLVIFDRHLLDMVVDPVRYRYGGPPSLARLACRLAPQPDVIVVLDAPPDVVRGRKQEVTPEESRRQSLAYRRLAGQIPGAVLVDATAAPEEVLRAVTTVLGDHIEAVTARAVGGTGRRHA